MSIDQAYNYRKVSESVATAGVVNPKQLSVLGENGVEVVINLLPEDSEYSVSDERKIVESQGIEYWYLPIDFAAPTLEEYEEFKMKLDQVESKKLLIHCAANYRVSAFYSRYAIERELWSVEVADEFMLSIWQPREYPCWTEWLAEVQHRGKSGKPA